MPPEGKPSKRQVNIRITDEAYERVRTWAFLEYSAPGTFLAGLIEHLAETVAEQNPKIDELVQALMEYRASQSQPPDPSEL